MALIRDQRLVPLGREVDIYVARELAARMAADVGFDQYACADIETAISELCSNAIKYGGGGWASLRVSAGAFDAVVTDGGPGMGAPPGKKVGLGVGLEGAGRLMDTLEVRQLERGTQVAMSKVHPNGARRDSGPWEAGAVTRAKRGQTVSGDRWWAGVSGDVLLAVVADGLGSGPAAAESAGAVVDTISRQDFQAPLDEMIAAANKAAESTRGAVAMVLRAAPPTLEICGVGDVNGRAEPSGVALSVRPGIVGVDISRMVVDEIEWQGRGHLLIWTDGVESPPSDDLGDAEVGLTPDRLDELILTYGDQSDDALLMAVSNSIRKG